nr:hypothetical protein [uncultured Psychrobacter sp.]
MELLLGILLVLWGLIFSGWYFFTSKRSKDQLSQLDNPVRQISAKEKLYLEPYMQKFNLSYPNEHADNVYLLEGGEVVAHTISMSGNTQTKLRLDDKHIYFPYRMDACIDNEINRIEVAVVKGRWPDSANTYYAIALDVNGAKLSNNAEIFLGADSSTSSKVISQRIETALEYDIRQSNIIYVKPAAFVIVTALLLLFASWCTGIFFYIYLLLAFSTVGFAIKYTRNIYQQHKMPQTVLTVVGHLVVLALRDIETLHKVHLEPCLSSTYYLRLPSYIKDKFPDFLETHKDVADYCVDITAHKQSGYTLLRTQDMLSLDKALENNALGADKRGILFFSIITIILCYLVPTGNIEDMITAFNLPTQYLNSRQVQSYKQAIAILFILILVVLVFLITLFSFFHKPTVRKKLE